MARQEDVSQMAVTVMGTHFSTHHAVTEVAQVADVVFHWFAECRPATARIKFVLRREQWLTGDDIHVQSVLKVVVIFSGKRALSGAFLGDAELQFRQCLNGLWVFYTVCSYRSPDKSHSPGRVLLMNKIQIVFFKVRVGGERLIFRSALKVAGSDPRSKGGFHASHHEPGSGVIFAGQKYQAAA